MKIVRIINRKNINKSDLVYLKDCTHHKAIRGDAKIWWSFSEKWQQWFYIDEEETLLLEELYQKELRKLKLKRLLNEHLD